MFRKAELYFHTLRYLKPAQIWGRVTFHLLRGKPDFRPEPAVRSTSGALQTPAARRTSMLSPTRFRFLNVEHEISAPADWNSLQLSKLWLYNLHYFDDLNADGAAGRSEWHRDLIARWLVENPPGHGNGWEPYPLSLRIINWIKWAQSGNALDELARHSLAVQARFLTKRLERHLLGNHLFANAKALVFAGCYFEGDEADVWLRLGMSILNREISEQILEDGGHFERSTMYHALTYEDMLDLANLARSNPAALSRWEHTVSLWSEIIVKMGSWLHTVSHPDTDLFSTVIPSKMFESMGMGIPLLHGVPGESAGIVEHEKVGIVFHSGDHQALHDAMMLLKDNHELFEQYRKRCIEAAPNYDRSRLAGEMLAILEGVRRKP